MGEPAQESEKKALDQGLEVGISRLNTDKIEKVINSVIKGETGAQIPAAKYIPTQFFLIILPPVCFIVMGAVGQGDHLIVFVTKLRFNDVHSGY